MYRVDLCVWDLTLTSPLCWLSLWESAVTSSPRLSPALWLQGGQPEGSPADEGAGSLHCCYYFLAGSTAISCAKSPPANIVIMVSEDTYNNVIVTGYQSVQVTHSTLTAYDPAQSDGSETWEYCQNSIWLSEIQSGQSTCNMLQAVIQTSVIQWLPLTASLTEDDSRTFYVLEKVVEEYLIFLSSLRESKVCPPSVKKQLYCQCAYSAVQVGAWFLSNVAPKLIATLFVLGGFRGNVEQIIHCKGILA